MSKLSIEEKAIPAMSLMLEVTRNCNLRCAHCMRGEPQNIDMSDEVLENTFRNINAVISLALTGGEPFLAPHVIEKMVDIIIANDIPVFHCGTVDNGTILDDSGIRSVKALNRLGEYIYNSVFNDESRKNNLKPVTISISNSEFHANDIQKAIDFYSQYTNEYVNVCDQGDWETGLRDKQGNPVKLKSTMKNAARWMKRSGRAKDNNISAAKPITTAYKIELGKEEESGRYYIDTPIHICANGNVCPMEPISFEVMDRINIGNIVTEPLLDMILKWSDKEPLSESEVLTYCENMKKLENSKIPEEKKGKYAYQNTYLNVKKILFGEFKKLFKYLSNADIDMLVKCSLMMMVTNDMEDFCKAAGFEFTEKEEKESIKSVIKLEFGDELDEEFKKNDIIKIFTNIVLKNSNKVLEIEGFLSYWSYESKLGKFDFTNIMKKAMTENAAYEE